MFDELDHHPLRAPLAKLDPYRALDEREAAAAIGASLAPGGDPDIALFLLTERSPYDEAQFRYPLPADDAALAGLLALALDRSMDIPGARGAAFIASMRMVDTDTALARFGDRAIGSLLGLLDGAADTTRTVAVLTAVGGIRGTALCALPEEAPAFAVSVGALVDLVDRLEQLRAHTAEEVRELAGWILDREPLYASRDLEFVLEWAMHRVRDLAGGPVTRWDDQVAVEAERIADTLCGLRHGFTGLWAGRTPLSIDEAVASRSEFIVCKATDGPEPCMYDGPRAADVGLVFRARYDDPLDALRAADRLSAGWPVPFVAVEARTGRPIVRSHGTDEPRPD
jgi:hypothetical protein